ncbi:hypothetical protein, partial [Pseudomonas aeruginosa]|uniref:hypothetical protein n=1 Tax=Pseudomonas aeruginosa TaxID=287 RepID=UPI003967FE9E
RDVTPITPILYVLKPVPDNLLEFWPACAASEGWLYRVEQGGWLDQECRREGFVARETKAVDEYFVNGGDRCLSVLSWSPPKVSPLI